MTSRCPRPIIRATWQIESIENATACVVSFTDATGSVESRSVKDPSARSLEVDTLNIESGSIIQVQVRAADVDDFLGPLSAVVSLSVD